MTLEEIKDFREKYHRILSGNFIDREKEFNEEVKQVYNEYLRANNGKDFINK